MSKTNDIKLLLDIQDESIEIEVNAVELKKYKGKMTKFITAKLTFTPIDCDGYRNFNNFKNRILYILN